MEIMQSPGMPKANGHYSMCVEHNGTLYLSGQLPLKEGTREPVEGIQAQTQLVLDKMNTILKSAGSHKNSVIQVRIYLADIELWDQVNEVYASFFEDHKPARVVVPTPKLHYGCLIELEAIAAH